MHHLFFLEQTKRFARQRFFALAFLAVGASSFLSSCSDDGTLPNPFLPAKITVAEPALSPEGVQYDELNQHFLVSSRTKGRIGAVEDNGTYTVFGDDSRLISTIGLNVDQIRHRVLVAVSDNGANTTRTTPATLNRLAGLAIFNSNNGNLTKYVDLSTLRPNQRHFANDIAVDLEGNAYVTDSFSPIIYKVDTDGNASIFLEDAQLGAATGFGLNGIVYHPDGYLIVAKSGEGVLFKVPINNPTAFSRVSTTQNVTGADGLLLLNAKTLLLVSGSQSTVYRLSSNDSWASASTTGSFATGPTSPTTITRRSISDAYVLYPYQATAAQFEITKVNF
ncbi:hypothetical protein [Hymenobacter cavernae]|uniref:SMP-30/Gluconolactonase/LRE-like region domain-containing protein n=1 Tax=Hymenobacter cavernae TaxID=2044852 RepID=A0ABQ1UGH6_9BACT|nr:hypothetical protein [Hymenobacter cavernae]GGF17213.1 hypothetical protein GCM10011383_30810 [Hymenobacter cavernae]